MPIPVQCPQCQQAFQVADKFAGCKIRCPKCGKGAISVGDPLSSDDSSTSDAQCQRKTPASTGSEKSQAASPSFRAKLQQKTVIGSLVAAGIGLGVLLFVGGIAVTLGNYAWRAIGRFNVPDMADQSLPKVLSLSESMPKADSGRQPIDSPSRGFVEQVKSAPPNMSNWRLYQSHAPFFEIMFPPGHVVRSGTSGGVQFAWLSNAAGRPGPNEGAVLGVNFFNRIPTESDLEAIARAERQTQIGAVGKDMEGVIVTRKTIQFKGLVAVERTFGGKMGPLVAVSISIAHRSGVYTIEGVANSDLISLAQLEAMRDSFRILDPSSMNDANSGPMPAVAFARPQWDERGLQAGRFTPKWSVFHCNEYPFEIQFPSDNVKVANRGVDSVEYACLGRERPDRGRGSLSDLGHFHVRHYPRLAGESDQDAVRRIEQIMHLSGSGTYYVDSHMEHVPGMLNGCYSVEYRRIGDRQRVRNLGILVVHPSGVYHVGAVINAELMTEQEIERFKRSFRFVR